jgi:hypothetical protein
MGGMIFTYGAFFALAAGIGFALGAALHRAVVGQHLLDLDGDVQSLRIRLTEAKGLQDGA